LKFFIARVLKALQILLQAIHCPTLLFVHVHCWRSVIGARLGSRFEDEGEGEKGQDLSHIGLHVAYCED